MHISKKKKVIFNIKLNITLKSHETFINQNAKNQKIEEQIKKIIKQEKPQNRGRKNEQRNHTTESIRFKNLQNALK